MNESALSKQENVRQTIEDVKRDYTRKKQENKYLKKENLQMKVQIEHLKESDFEISKFSFFGKKF